MKTTNSLAVIIAVLLSLMLVAGCGVRSTGQESREEVVASWERFIASAKARTTELTPVYKRYHEWCAANMHLSIDGRSPVCDSSFQIVKDDVKASDSLKSKFIGTATVVYHAYYGGSFDGKLGQVVLEWEVQYSFGFRNGTWFFMDGLARPSSKITIGNETTKDEGREIKFSLDYDNSHDGQFQRWGAILFGEGETKGKLTGSTPAN